MYNLTAPSVFSSEQYSDKNAKFAMKGINLIYFLCFYLKIFYCALVPGSGEIAQNSEKMKDKMD